MKNLAKITLVFAVFAFTFSQAKPAKAFYLEVPQVLKDIFSSLNINKTSAQESPTLESQTNFQTPPAGMGEQPQPEQQGNTIMPPQPPTKGMMQQGDQGRGIQGSQDEARQMEQMKRGTKQMASQIKQFESMIANAEKKGITVPEEIKANLAKMKSLLESVNNATSMDELRDVDMGEMGDLMQSMDEFRRDVVEKQQRLDGMKRGMKGMEQGLKMFKTQIAKLTKQKITVPSELSDNIAKLEAIIAQVKTAKTSEEIDAIDFESMQDLMQSLDENRQQLEILARWPQTLKQINAELTRLTREQAKSKTIVDRLAKKGMDLQTEYTAFAEAISKLKAVRDDAVAKMAAGNSEEAFTALQDDFFGQMEDVWQNQKVIMTMSNLGRFASDFKQNMAQVNSMVKRLQKTKVDTTELEAIISQAKEKGQEVLNLIKAKPLDADAVTSALDELENLKQEFDDKISELTGEDDNLPWEQGPQQFKQVDLPQGFNNLSPQNPTPKTSPLQPTI